MGSSFAHVCAGTHRNIGLSRAGVIGDFKPPNLGATNCPLQNYILLNGEPSLQPHLPLISQNTRTNIIKTPHDVKRTLENMGAALSRDICILG